MKEFPHEGYRMGDRLSRRQEQNKSEGKPLVAVELHGQRALILDIDMEASKHPKTERLAQSEQASERRKRPAWCNAIVKKKKNGLEMNQ